MEDSRLTYLVSKLSLNSVQLEQLGDGGTVTLDTIMAAAALGMRRDGKRRLSLPAYTLGRAIYAGDEKHRTLAIKHGVKRVIKMGHQRRWPDPDPANYIQHLRRSGKFTEAELANKEQTYFVKYKFLLVQLAMAEIQRNGNCRTCNGTGKTENYRTCEPCSGTGKRPMTHSDRANFTKQEYQKWYSTWRPRYPHVFMLYVEWLSEFEDHIKRVCR